MTGANSSNVRVHHKAVGVPRGYRTESVLILVEVRVKPVLFGRRTKLALPLIHEPTAQHRFLPFEWFGGQVWFLRAPERQQANELPGARRGPTRCSQKDTLSSSTEHDKRASKSSTRRFESGSLVHPEVVALCGRPSTGAWPSQLAQGFPRDAQLPGR